MKDFGVVRIFLAIEKKNFKDSNKKVEKLQKISEVQRKTKQSRKN